MIAAHTPTRRPPERTQAVEDYVKVIWKLTSSNVEPTGQAISLALGVSQASVTAMLKRLDELGLATYERYRTVELTDAGRLLALEIVRHHRLLELFLVEILGMGWEHVHDEAEVLEHHISERLEELIAARLGDPAFDPHGHPIPRLDGSVPVAMHTPLASLVAGDMGRIAQVRTEQPDVLTWLSEQGLGIAELLRVEQVHPHAGTITVSVGDSDEQTVLGSELARLIDIEPSVANGGRSHD